MQCNNVIFVAFVLIQGLPALVSAQFVYYTLCKVCNNSNMCNIERKKVTHITPECIAVIFPGLALQADLSSILTLITPECTETRCNYA